MNASSLAPLLAASPRHLFFTGKGGVGKTSLACATAVALADAGHRVLLVSTDPASNLDEVLATPLGPTPRAVPGAPGLDALNLDPVAAAAAYREKIIGPVRGLLPASAVRSMEEQLSGACTVEIAAFDAFARLLGDRAATAEYRHVLFDTAPTGHTLRLLSLPRAWTHFLRANTTGTSCLGPLAGLDAQRAVYSGAMQTLADAAETLLVLVARPQLAALREAQRTATELREAGLANQFLVVNGTVGASTCSDAIASAMAERSHAALAAYRSFVDSLPGLDVPLRARTPLGVDGVRALAGLTAEPPADPGVQPALPAFTAPAALLAGLAAPGRGVIMTLGKGGVGKTTVAAAIAVALASQGHRVHLTTTDPAAHAAAAVGEPPAGLTVSRIDPAAETADYVAQVLADQGAALDAAARAVLEEDLRSPCTEEIAVFRAFARTVAAGRDGFVVLDTAPTGHTLLLLDATEAHHRELGRQARETAPPEVRELLPRLRDPDFTRMLLVTLPEATPVHEAATLQADLRRSCIKPFAWVINQCLALTGTTDPLLAARARNEARFFTEVTESLARRVTALPWRRNELVGPAALARLFAAETLIMTTYVYETVPQQPDEKLEFFQVKQGMSEPPLAAHPETGKPVRRVVLGGYGVLKAAPARGSRAEGGCCGTSGCC